jgi:two-component system OmpR family response regulator
MVKMESPQQSVNRSRVIMGVDDSPEDRAFLNMTLMAAGYSFVGAASGEQCLALIHRASPKLILLDVEMPYLNGFETCQRLRTIREARSIPIAFLTARNSGDDVRHGLAAGGNDFIVKPFKRDKLLERVHHWMMTRVGGAR